MSSPALSQGSKVLVTGATGTLGSWVSNELIAAGYHVVAPVRDAEKGKMITKVLEKRHGEGKFSITLVPDMAAKGAFDEAMKDCVGVCHIMSDTSQSPDPNVVLPKTLAFVNNILTAAANTPSVKRVVYTSSQAVLPRFSEPGTIDNSSWCANADELIAYARAEPHTPDKALVVYVASKLLEERACWDFVKREKPSFTLNSVIPGFLIGANLDPGLISSSHAATLGLLQSHPAGVGFITSVSPSGFVNTRDAALLHLAALTDEGISNRRLLAVGEAFDLNRTIDVLRKLVPRNNLPPKMVDVDKAIAVTHVEYESGLLRGLGQDGFLGFEESVAQCVSTAGSGAA